MTFWCGSGSGSRSADPCLGQMDPDADPDPAIFVIDLQRTKKNLILLKSFFAYYFLKRIYVGIFYGIKTIFGVVIY
jgi:hypothetical protein